MISLPKSGNYTFELRDANSALTHSEAVTVPFFDEPVALAQTIKLHKDNGPEEAWFDNAFQDPLDVDLAELSKEMLRKKATLEVNADDYFRSWKQM